MAKPIHNDKNSHLRIATRMLAPNGLESSVDRRASLLIGNKPDDSINSLRKTNSFCDLRSLDFADDEDEFKENPPCPTTDTVRAENPLMQVSNEYMRVIGVQQPFKKILSKRVSQTFGEDRVLESTVVELEPSTETSTKRRLMLRADTVEQGIFGNKGMNKLMKKHARCKRTGNGEVKQHTGHTTVQERLQLRKILYVKRTRLNDYCTVIAAITLGLALADAEFGVISTTHSIVIRSVLLLSSLVLIVFILVFHSIEVQLSSLDTGADAWLLSVSSRQMISIALEIFICCLQPLPGMRSYIIPELVQSESTTRKRLIETSLDTWLTLAVFLRCYLVGRFMVMHNSKIQDAATRTIASLNHVSVNFAFVIKSAILEKPTKVIVLFTICYSAIVSWMFFYCERSVLSDYRNAVWFIVITFMTIGYGDVVPHTTCGRFLSVLTGIMGLGVASALIAVIHRKLQLSSAEKHVNLFMADSKLIKKKKNIAARILQHMWFIYKYRCLKKGHNVVKVRIHQRKFLGAIEEFRRAKWEQRKLAEQNSQLTDFTKLELDMSSSINEVREEQKSFSSNLTKLNEKVLEMQSTLNSVASTLAVLAHKRS